MSFETLIEELADPDRPLTASKLAGLSGMRVEEASRFAGAWPSLDVQRRQKVVQELVDLAEDNVDLNFDAAFTAALADEDAGVRRAAIQGLWEHDGRDLIEPLARMLDNDPDAAVRAEAALALGRFMLQAELGVLRSQDSDRIEAALRRTVTDPIEIEEVRARALEALGALTQDWVRDLIQDAYDGDDRRLRISAVHAMGRSAEPDWLSSIYTEAESDDAEMRYEAALAMGSIAEEEAVPNLVPLLDDEDAEVRQAAIAALGQIGGRAAKETLRELLAGSDETLRDAAVEALEEVEFAEDPLAVKIDVKSNGV